LDQYLAEAAISGISELDTRAITRKLRTQGTMMGIVTSDKTPEQALELLNSVPRYGQTNFVKDVSTRSVFRWQDDRATHPFHLAVLDCGVNYGILRALSALDCAVTVVPSATSAEEILNLKPNGVIISPGPGNPDLLGNIVSSIEKLIGRLPIMGICLGAQLITHAFGGKSLKLSFGHRGANQPVRELRTKRVHITSQNHTYVPDPDSLPSELGISHVSLNDGTIEGVRHKSLPIFAVQYWTEASPRTLGSFQVFEEFLEMVRGAK
ncbi:MAG: carbamoyl phosphate synthase small subunit, partial [Dehalococcoidia bacterium]|nr:carbamoyl phosphate synthase small subunit [Dehalococcoidia bacterium]